MNPHLPSNLPHPSSCCLSSSMPAKTPSIRGGKRGGKRAHTTTPSGYQLQELPQLDTLEEVPVDRFQQVVSVAMQQGGVSAINSDPAVHLTGCGWATSSHNNPIGIRPDPIPEARAVGTTTAPTGRLQGIRLLSAYWQGQTDPQPRRPRFDKSLQSRAH